MACNENGLEAKHFMEASHTAVEIKIKTLDSQVYTCCVEKNVSVPDLKEQVALVTGVPSQNQRLICRGKVLKDEHALSAYEVEDGHTLHLVTRPGPPSVPISIEDNESHDYSSYNRSGHISHSVLVGTFNFPDRNNGVLPELNRILSSVLSSLQVGSYFLPPLGPGNGILTQSLHSSGNAFIGAQEGEEHADQILEQRMVDQATPTVHHIGFDPVGGLFEPRQEASVVGGMPGISHVRILHQIVPNALRTLSQHVDRMEQIYMARNDQAQILSANVSHSAQPQSSVQPLLTSVEDWNPAAWGSLFRRIQELLGNHAAPDLGRLANQLQGEPSLETLMARSNLLFTGMILEQLGRLLLNLGGTALAISREPAQLGGVSASTADPAASLQSGETTQHVDGVDLTRNMDIHIHTGFPSSFLVTRNLLSHSAHDGPSLSLTIDGMRNPSDDHANPGSNTNQNSFIHPSSLDSLQAAANLHVSGPGSADVPEILQDSLLLDGSNGSRGVFYPLLARFPQLDSTLFSRHSLFGQSSGEGGGGSSVPRNLGSSNHQYPSVSVLQDGMQNESSHATINHAVADKGLSPATSPHLEAQDPQSESDAGYNHRSTVEPGHDCRIACHSLDCQDLTRPLFHGLEVLPSVSSEQDKPGIDQGNTNRELLGQENAETSLQLKCFGQALLGMEGSCAVPQDGLSLSNSHNLGPALSSVDNGKICSTSREIETFSDVLQSDQLCPFLCRTGRQGSEEPCKLEDPSTIARRGTVLQDFLSTLACGEDERGHLQLASTEKAHDFSLVIEKAENQAFGLNGLGSNAALVSSLASPHSLIESPVHKQSLEIGLDTPGASSGLENFENDTQRSAVKGFRLGNLHDSNCNDDVKCLQQFFPLAHIPSRRHLSPSLHFDELEKGKAMSMDTGSVLTFQELSNSATLADNELEDLRRHIIDQSFEGFHAVKRQKML